MPGMIPSQVVPTAVPPASVRRLPDAGSRPEIPVQRLAVPVVPPARVVPRQADPAGLRSPVD